MIKIAFFSPEGCPVRRNDCMCFLVLFSIIYVESERDLKIDESHLFLHLNMVLNILA
jgi:hypothetical protein